MCICSLWGFKKRQYKTASFDVYVLLRFLQSESVPNVDIYTFTSPPISHNLSVSQIFLIPVDCQLDSGLEVK